MDVKRITPIVCGAAAWMLLAGSIVSGRQQHQPHRHGDLSGIHGLPVEGHDVVAGVEIVGTKQIDLPKIHNRLLANGADLRLGLPLESPMLCRFKEVLEDVMREKGYFDAEVTHDARPTYGDPRQLTLKFTIAEGKRSRRIARATPLPSPAERCSR